jgi:H/ACA ribonucleoprotein complex subunit 4
MALVKQDDGEEKIIKPEAVTPKVDTSDWPLLLKNWDQRQSRN